jgi:hypothetical protein
MSAPHQQTSPFAGASGAEARPAVGAHKFEIFDSEERRHDMVAISQLRLFASKARFFEVLGHEREA